MVLVSTQSVKAPLIRTARRIDANMGDPELGPDLVVGIVAGLDLCADIHCRSPSQLWPPLGGPADLCRPLYIHTVDETRGAPLGPGVGAFGRSID